jgi:hypothetical protein
MRESGHRQSLCNLVKNVHPASAKLPKAEVFEKKGKKFFVLPSYVVTSFTKL